MGRWGQAAEEEAIRCKWTGLEFFIAQSWNLEEAENRSTWSIFRRRKGEHRAEDDIKKKPMGEVSDHPVGGGDCGGIAGT